MSLTAWIAGLEWLLALAWTGRVATTLLHLCEIPNLLDENYAPLPGYGADAPALAVIVPALNEQDAIGACLRSLLASQGIRLEIVAVDDRSSDATGAIMDAVAHEAAAAPHGMRVLHIRDLPSGWLGKPHALAAGAACTTAPLLLFTDADALFAPDALARAARYMEKSGADHLVLLPTPILKSWGERTVLGMLQAYALWGVRLWKVADPRAHDFIGVGCFNLLRRDTYEQIGQMDAVRMEVVEDLRLGYLVKSRGFRQRAATGIDLLRLHWAPGAFGIASVLEKNFFALCRYNPWMLLFGVLGTAILTLGPVIGLFGPPEVSIPCAFSMLVLALTYLAQSRRTRIPAAYVLLFPLGSLLILYAMLRSAALTLARGGVSWRGTFYPLAELRQHAGRLWWWQLRKPR